MRAFWFAIALLIPVAASAQVVVKPYVRSDGTVVRPHLRTTPDGSTYNNYGTLYNNGARNNSGLFAPVPQPRVQNPVRSQNNGLFGN